MYWFSNTLLLFFLFNFLLYLFIWPFYFILFMFVLPFKYTKDAYNINDNLSP